MSKIISILVISWRTSCGPTVGLSLLLVGSSIDIPGWFLHQDSEVENNGRLP